MITQDIPDYVQPIKQQVNLNPMKDSPWFNEQETSPSLLSTGWFQERIRGFHNQIKIN